MIDVSYFQNSTNNAQIFQNGGTWQTWIKPRNAKTVSFFIVGAGAGGGGGFEAATGAKSGGSGGGSGANTKLIVQASTLPDILYILPGTGGDGGTGGATGVVTSGSSATKSYVCLIPDISSTSNIIHTSGNVSARGGGAGSTSSIAGGAAETVAISTNAIFQSLGIQLNVGGTAGQTSNTGNTSAGAVASFLVTAGAGGGTGTGGGLNGGGPFPVIANTPINTNGRDGLIFYKPIFGLSGGRGGGGGTTGGNGGNGAPGCGGGGGGAGTVSAGNGGRGGDGFVIITTNF
jgi:hypothetical protein